jgi:hypothetical protein
MLFFAGSPKGARIAQGGFRLRIDAAALKACTGIVALCWVTTGIAAPAGTAAFAGPHPVARSGSTLLSIRLLPSQPGLAGTCGGSAFTVNTLINVTAQASADVKVSAPGVGTIEEFTDETGKNIGPYDAAYPMFQILAFGGGLAPNTPITISITTYAGPNLSGATTFVSVLEFNCTTGQVLATQPLPLEGAIAVPTLSPLALAATALLVLIGAGMLRRRAALRRARR